MSIKKTGFSYFLCILFGLISSGVLIAASFETATALGQENNLIFAGIALIIGIIMITCITLCHKIFDKVAQNGGITLPEGNGFVEAIFLFIIIVSGFLVRVMYLTSLGGEFNGDTTYLDVAVQSEPITGFCNAEIVYIKALAYAIALFGTKMVSSIYFQILCQLIIIACLFYTVKFLMNRVAASVAICLYTFIPVSVHQIEATDPQVFITMLFAVGLLLIVTMARLSHYMLIGSGKSLFLFLVVGFYCGFLGFLDPLGLFAILVMCCVYGYAQSDSPDMVGQKAGAQIAIGLLGAVIGLAGCFFLESIIECNELTSVVSNYVSIFTKGITLNSDIALPANTSLFSLILVSCTIPWMLRIKKIERDFGSPIVWLPIGAAVLSFLGISKIQYNEFMTYMWSITAVFGLFSIGVNKLENENLEEMKKEFDKVAKANVFTKKANDNIVTKSVTLQGNNKPIGKTPQVKLTSNSKTNLREMEESLEFLKKGDLKPKMDANTISNATPKQDTPKGVPIAVGSGVPVSQPQMKTNGLAAPTIPVNSIANANGGISNDHQSAAILKTNASSEAPKTTIITQTNSVTLSAEPAPLPQTPSTPVVQQPMSAPSEIEKSEIKSSIPSTGINNTNMGSNANENNGMIEKPQSVTAIPPKTNAPIPPTVKYGRRLDYKTAKVSNAVENPLLGKGNPALKSATIVQQEIDSKKPIPTPPKEDSMKMEEIPIEEISIPIPQKAMVSTPATVPAMVPGMNDSKKPVASSMPGAEQQLQQKVTEKKPLNQLEDPLKQNAPVKTVSSPIPNPLPTPRKHVTKELEFDILPQTANMHFDIVDLKEYDHFDIN